jgi:ATP-dependent DNA helicase PIF1
MNMVELDKLSGERVTFSCTDDFSSTEVGLDGNIIQKRINRVLYSKIMDGSVVHELVLKIGAQVMLLINMSLEDGLCNGSRGVVVDIDDNGVNGDAIISVKWVSGMTTKLDKHIYVFEDDVEKVKYFRFQFPLALAFSVSIHKSQGQTLDCVACDIGSSVFEFGQGYTALSRVREPSNLYLTAFDERFIKAEPDALAFDEWISSVVDKRDSQMKIM